MKYSNFAFSESGEILDLHTRTIKNNARHMFSLTAIYVKIYLNNRSLLVHRVLSEAWIYNPTPETTFLVNHKNGKKNDNFKDNLEWTTHSDNLRHAVNTGLRSDNIHAKIKYYKSNTPITFSSVADMCLTLKVSQRYNEYYRTLATGKHIHGYEVRLDGDNRDWYYKSPNPKPLVPIRAHIEFEFNNNFFYNKPALGRFLKTRTKESVEYYIKFVKEHYNTTLNIRFFKDARKWQAINIKTKVITTVNSLRELHKITGVTLSVLMVVAVKGKNEVRNGYCFRRYSDEEWNLDNLITKPYNINITVTNGSFVKHFTSAHKTAIYFNTTHKTIMNHTITKKPLNGFIISLK